MIDISPTPPVDLDRFFAPRSVALIGATDDTGKFGGQVFQQMLKFGYPGRIFPVNPRRQTLSGLPCYTSIAEVPEVPDHVGIVVPRYMVMTALAECQGIGVRFVTVLTGGFAESGNQAGIALQKKVVDFARSAGMRLMGPNCNGLINFVDRFLMSSSTSGSSSTSTAKKNIAVVSQSGGLGQVNVMWRTIQAGLGVNYQVSCGNESDLDLMDFASYVLHRDSTEVLLMAVEGIRNPQKFIEVAEYAAENDKPIVVLKFGRSELGRKMAASHTGSLAGSDEIFDAVSRQFGIIRVDDCNQLYETAIALRGRKRPQGLRMGAVAPSGGNAVQVADLGSTLGLDWPAFSVPIEEKLCLIYPEREHFDNPIDTRSTRGTLVPSIETIAMDTGIDAVLAVFTMINRASMERICKLSRECSKPVFILWTGRCTDDDNFTVADLVELGIPAWADTLTCLKAVTIAARYQQFRAQFRRRDLLVHPVPNAPAAARRHIEAIKRKLLTEREAKLVLAEYGIPVSVERLASSAAEACDRANEIGTPVALKIESADIPHKTEAGAVRLNLKTDAEIRKGYEEVIQAARRHSPDADIAGVLVQKMTSSGLEMIIGIATDSVFGPVVVTGLGGIHVEVLKDIAYRLPPIAHAEALVMIRELRASKILDGVRGSSPRDISALADCIVRASWMASDMRDLVAEVDINPLFLLEEGACAVDALIVKH